MRIIFWGTPLFAVESLNQIYNEDHQIIAVVTQPDRRRERGKKLCASPIKQRANELGIKTYTPKSISKDAELKKTLKELNPDLNVVVAFGQILPSEILNIPKYGSWNSHASLLPRWRGAAPIHWSLIKGDKNTGVCIMYMEETLDTGPVILQEKLVIKKSDNLTSLSNSLSILSAILLVKAISMISNLKISGDNNILNNLNAIEQKNLSNKVCYARQLNKSDYALNFDLPSNEIVNKINGLYPNAYCLYNNKRLKILEASVFNSNKNTHNHNNYDKNQQIASGSILAITTDNKILISTRNSQLLIHKAKLEGKCALDGKSLIQQLGIEEGEILKSNIS